MGTRDDEYDYLFKGKNNSKSNSWNSAPNPHFTSPFYTGLCKSLSGRNRGIEDRWHWSADCVVGIDVHGEEIIASVSQSSSNWQDFFIFIHFRHSFITFCLYWWLLQRKWSRRETIREKMPSVIDTHFSTDIHRKMQRRMTLLLKSLMMSSIPHAKMLLDIWILLAQYFQI